MAIIEKKYLQEKIRNCILKLVGAFSAKENVPAFFNVQESIKLLCARIAHQVKFLHRSSQAKSVFAGTNGLAHFLR